MQTIENWLKSNRIYTEGVNLYLIHGKNEFLKKRFQAICDDYSKKKLAEELQQLLTESTREARPQDTAKVPLQTNIIQEADQAHYLGLLRKRDDIVKQIERNMAVLDLSTDRNVLHQTAKQILKLHQKKCETWEKIDFYQTHGHFQLEPKKAIIPKEKKIQQLYQAISKAKKRLADPKCKNQTKTQQLLHRHEARLQKLKTHADHQSETNID